MHLVLQTPSLQQLARVKLVAHLWTQRDIFIKIAKTRDQFPVNVLREDLNEWKEIEEKVESKVAALPIPEKLKKQLFNLVKPLVMEIMLGANIIAIRRLILNFLNTSYLNNCVGRCTEPSIMVKRSQHDHKRRRMYAYMNINDWASLIVFFTCTFFGGTCLHYYFQGNRSQNESINKRLFKSMLRSGTRATCEYLFKRLDQREKEQILEEFRLPTLNHLEEFRLPTLNHIYAPFSGNVLLYFWSLLNAEQQERVLRRDVYDVLMCLLRWPMQSLFMDSAESVWQFMNDCKCSEMLYAIISKLSDGFRDFDYCQLFWKCWRLTSAEHKEHFLNNFQHEGAFSQVLALCNQRYGPSDVLLDESSISDAALMECKETAALKSSNEPQDWKKGLRGLLIDSLMKRRIKRR